MGTLENGAKIIATVNEIKKLYYKRLYSVDLKLVSRNRRFTSRESSLTILLILIAIIPLIMALK